MTKSRDAFRTISEVAEWLDTPAHVLRFWESKFTQVKPVKRAGGRRYYRPTDMKLLGGIKKLLHEDGMTIKGVQKILREQGVKHVSSLSIDIDGGDTQSAEQTRVDTTHVIEDAPFVEVEASVEDSVLTFTPPVNDRTDVAATTDAGALADTAEDEAVSAGDATETAEPVDGAEAQPSDSETAVSAVDEDDAVADAVTAAEDSPVEPEKDRDDLGAPVDSGMTVQEAELEEHAEAAPSELADAAADARTHEPDTAPDDADSIPDDVGTAEETEITAPEDEAESDAEVEPVAAKPAVDTALPSFLTRSIEDRIEAEEPEPAATEPAGHDQVVPVAPPPVWEAEREPEVDVDAAATELAEGADAANADMPDENAAPAQGVLSRLLAAQTLDAEQIAALTAQREPLRALVARLEQPRRP